MTDIVALYPPHPDDCQVCGGRQVIQVHLVRFRGPETYVSQVGRIAPCPFKTGAAHLSDLVSPRVAPRGDGAA